MKHFFVKGQDGNWFNEKTKYYLGTEEGFYEHMMFDNDWDIRQVIDDIMEKVNSSLEEED